jgi:hypothetical protein
MQTKHVTAVLKIAAPVLAILSFATAAYGQQTINLTAAPTTTTMPDGTTVPMWGYSCGTAVTGSTATCAALNPAAAAAGTWSPVVITVPAASAGATALTINLTNNLLFTPAGTGTQNSVPTSIAIMGQVGGGLGVLGQRTTTASPDHSLAQGCQTWFIASGATPPGVPCTSAQSGSNVPPAQPQGRVQSFGTEVAAGTTTSLAWPVLVPGTYLLESGTHPSIQVPMGLIGMLVVTTPAGTAAGTAYPGATTTAGAVPAVTYNAELPLEFSEIDPVQNNEVDAAVSTPGFTETNTRTLGGAIGSITVTSGGTGYTVNPAVTVSAPGGTGTTATASAAVGAVITGVTLSSGGSGYAAGTTVTLPAPGTGGTQATAVPNLRFGVASITAPTTGTGAGYAAGDVLSFNSGGGASATATVSTVTATGGITGVTFTATTGAGTGYAAAPTISSVSGPQSVTSVALLSGGSGYAVGNTLNLTGGTTNAVVTVTAIGGTAATGPITGLTFSGGAGYTTPPTANTNLTGAGTGASFVTALATGAVLTTALSTTGSISSITITNGGSLYTTPIAASAVAISAPTGGTPAVVGSVTTAGTAGSVYSVSITNLGSGYISAPTVTIAAGTTTATASASLSPSCKAGGGCYPSAVNYTPFYYLINGRAFDKTHPAASVFAAYAGIPGSSTAPVTTGIAGTVLARLVNAGLRMHVPSVVGSLTNGFTGAGVATTAANPVGGFTLIAEDGNVIPGVAVAGNATVPAAPRVQTHVFMAAGKVFDVMFNVPATATAPALPIYDRELSLSANSSTRDAGMLAYIGVNGAGLPVAAGTAGSVFAPPVARADTYNGISTVAGQAQPFSVSDVSKGVIANDTNVYGVALSAAPAHGTLTCNAQPQNPVPGICANGTFTYTPTGTTATSDSFTYCANGTTATSTPSICATVTLGASTLAGNPTAVAHTYPGETSTYLKIASPGLLIGNSDPSGLPITVVTSPAATMTGGTLVVDPKGGFVASLSGTPTAATVATFNYTVQDSQGRTSGAGLVTINFPAPSNLTVNVVDAAVYQAAGCNATSTVTPGTGIICGTTTLPLITDYRWIIEEDKTFWIDPNCTTNSSATTPGCPAVVAAGGTVPTFGTNFHASHMDYIAQGCTGPLSCEVGQTMLDTRPGSATLGQHIPAVCDLGNGACRPDPNCTALPCTGSNGMGGTTAVNPSSVHLDPTKRYYISVLPGDAGNPFPAYTSAPNCLATPFNPDGSLNTQCGHTMSGAQVQPACNIFTTGCTSASTAAFAPVTVKVAPTPLPTAKLSVFVFEDDFPLNGEQDGGGGGGTVAPLEPGLGGFELILWDTYGGLGDVTGQDTHDMFNMPLSNSLAGTIDPATGFDACPISAQVTANAFPTPPGSPVGGDGNLVGSQAGITGRIVTCPKYESDNATLSPLAGQAVIANLMADKFSVQAYPGADRIARGEEWLQTNTLDGQHPHDAFVRVGEPGYFQEFGPSGYHVSIGFANPKIINDRKAAVCAGAYGAVGPCANTIDGQVDVQRISRTPDQRLYPSGSRDALTWTQCWVSLGDPDAEDFMFTKCDANGNFKFTGVPGGNWRLTIGDQWNDQIIDGLSTPANVGCVPTPPATTCNGGLSSLHLGNIGVQQWQSNIYTRLFVDDNKNGIKDPDEIGVPQVYTRVKYRDGHNANTLLTDPDGIANFNETFPLFNWYVVEPDLGRYKRTGTHTVYDAGGPADGSIVNGVSLCGANGNRPCGTSTAYNNLANTYESLPLPADLHVPGAVYCVNADCAAEAAGFAAGTASTSAVTNSTGRLDPPWVNSEGWSGMTSQGNWIEFGVAPYAACNPALPVSATNFCVSVPNAVNNPTAGGTTASTKLVGENGGIHGHTTYAATRPFDDASQMIEQPWAPNVPGVTLNLYQEGFAADGVTPTLTMVDTTVSTSWDAWAQGFYPGATGTPGVPAGSGPGAGQKPYMSCPGQGTSTGTNADLFFYSLFDQPEYLDWYASLHNVASGGPSTLHTLPYNSQYKCYDSMHIWNQTQPAPYDGYYSFPSSLGVNATTGKPLTINGSSNGVASKMAGTNCTVCVANPDTTDVYRVGTPMLPPGKYVVEVIMPPGYEVYKEEDKNLLIGDNFIAPATVQFAGLGGSIFILPDQASVASMYDPSGAGYNPSNYQNATTALGTGEQLALPGFPGYQDPIWPCVGEMRVVPDYLSLFPQALEVAPFAGATRPLCDRKEVTLPDGMSVSAKFFIYTSTHIAAHFTGVITDDFTSEFDPFSPQFGEKFSPPNLPVATKDYLGNEISRVYADHWGTYESVNFSTWEVNPPNITGYGPSMMVQCMNDKGPILDTRLTIPNPNNPALTIANPTHGQMITDPLYNPAYSQFCYEEPYMPGLTTYLDTPVVPTQAFVGAAYNNPDCAYPDATPAISEVDGDGIGPWVSATGPRTLTITALGNVQVDNSGYSGPSASVAPFSLKKVQRHYGFGATKGTVMIGTYTVPAANIAWADPTITLTIPATATIPACQIQQQSQYVPTGTTVAQCGQLVITTANTAATGSPSNARQSIDTVTVTIGGSAPVHVPPSQTIQSFIDMANPGDLIIVDPTCTTTAGLAATCATPSATNIHNPATHNEMVIMWKPVRLQGAGAASAIIDANAHPSGKLLGPWRAHINCFVGLALNGAPYTAAGGSNVYDPSGNSSCPDTSGAPWNQFSANPDSPQIDRLPLEATVGWDANLNGNIAELLQEPTLMGAYEGAGITVLAKGVEFYGQTPWNDGSEAGGFPAGATLLTGVGPNPLALPVGDANPLCHTLASTGNSTNSNTPSDTNPYPSNFTCNPSSIDGLSVTDSSQGGGGIFIHGWAHHLQVANTRIFNNAGTLTGGISVGQGEFAGPYVVGSATNAAPGSCSNGAGLLTNQHMPDCFQIDVNVHNNMITNNSSLGDELFSATLSGGGGATLCTGNDYYKFNYNWVCGNLSAGEGGGITHLGEIQNGDIEHNAILLNQSSNPTIPTNGGGIMVQGTPDTDPVCPGVADSDCPPGLSDGTGHNLMINANLIQGNSADSGSGGGIRLNQVNGTEVSTFPGRPNLWNNVTIQNNIIVNNLAGWDGAGISLQDALNVNIINNTIAHNDSTATSGVLTTSLGTPMASGPAGNCTLTGPTGTNTASCPQPAGVSSTRNSTLLTTTFTGLTITCPAGQATGNGCRTISNPILGNNIIWQNRSFQVGISAAGTGTLNQQNLVTLYNASFTGGVGGAAPAQATTGACSTGSYWDLGVRGDTGPTNHTGGALTPTYSVLSSGGYGGTNSTTTPPVVSQYCNGSRVPPECTTADGCGGPKGFGVPPGIADAVTPNPVFSFAPSATVDEGNNWINVSWGPLSVTNPAVLPTGGNYGGGPALANYNLTAAVNSIPASQPHPFTDFYGNLRPEPGESLTTGTFDPGAIEFGSSGGTASFTVSPSSLAFGSQAIATTSGSQTITVTNAGNLALTGGTFTLTGSTTFTRAGGSCGATLAVAATCTYNVVFRPTAAGTNYSGSVAFAYSSTIGPATGTGTPVSLSGTGVAAGPLAFTAATNATLGTVFGVRSLIFTIPAGRTPVTSVVTITNNGPAGSTPVTITTESVTGIANTLFSLTGTSCGAGTLPATLNPGATCTISIRYATPVAAPPVTFPWRGLAAVANNGSGTVGGSTNLALSGR